jgi:hypothetical protein
MSANKAVSYVTTSIVIHKKTIVFEFIFSPFFDLAISIFVIPLDALTDNLSAKLSVFHVGSL